MHTWLLFPSPDSFRPHLLFTKFSASLFSCFSFPFILFLPSFSSFPTPFFSSSPLGFPTPVYFLFLCFLLSYFFYIPMFPLVTIVYFSFCFPLLFPNALVFLSSPSFNFVISHFLFFYLLFLVSSLIPHFSPPLLLSWFPLPNFFPPPVSYIPLPLTFFSGVSFSPTLLSSFHPLFFLSSPSLSPFRFLIFPFYTLVFSWSFPLFFTLSPSSCLFSYLFPYFHLAYPFSLPLLPFPPISAPTHLFPLHTWFYSFCVSYLIYRLI